MLTNKYKIEKVPMNPQTRDNFFTNMNELPSRIFAL